MQFSPKQTISRASHLPWYLSLFS